MKIFKKIEHCSYEQKINLLNKEDCPISIIEALLKDNFCVVRRKAALHINLSLDKLKELSKSSDKFIREGVALNLNSNKDILDYLSNDNDYYVKQYVSINRNTSEDILNNLYEEFPIEVLNNPNCPDYLKVFSK